MSLLKQIFTGSNSSTLLPAVEPTSAAYLRFKAKFYGSMLGGTNVYKTRANSLKRYRDGAMKFYKKILKQHAKYPIS